MQPAQRPLRNSLLFSSQNTRFFISGAPKHLVWPTHLIKKLSQTKVLDNFQNQNLVKYKPKWLPERSWPAAGTQKHTCFTRVHVFEGARNAGCLDLATLGSSGASRGPFWSRLGPPWPALGPPGVPSGAALGPLRGDEISRQKVFRDRCAPDVQSPLLSGPVWGRQPHRRSGPLSTCAQERGRERMRLWEDRENSAKNPQRLPRVNSPKSPPPGPNPPAAGQTQPSETCYFSARKTRGF